MGGNHKVAVGDGLGFGALFVVDPPLPLWASMMIWLSLVYTSTQAESLQSAKAVAGMDKSRLKLRIIKRFMRATISAYADGYRDNSANCG